MYCSHRLWDPWGGVGHVTMGYLGTLLGRLVSRCAAFFSLPTSQPVNLQSILVLLGINGRIVACGAAGI